MQGGIQIPGPGSATALFATVAIYTAGFAELSSRWRFWFLVVAAAGIAITVFIELFHGFVVDNDDVDVSLSRPRLRR